MKDCFDFHVPVMGAVAEAVQHSLEEPVFVLLGIWVANGWFNNCDLVIQVNALVECVLAVALFKGAPPFDGHAD